MEVLTFSTIISICAGLMTIIGLLTVVISFTKKIKEIMVGQQCVLRSEMLNIYYKHTTDKIIRQYEYENFVKLYEAYVALGGNSFILKIYEEVKQWDVIT